jgi:hypothetical protein
MLNAQPWPKRIAMWLDDELSEAAMCAVKVDDDEPVWCASPGHVAAYLFGKLRPELDEFPRGSC